MLVSPGTLKILTFISLGTSGFDKNHSAFDQEFKIFNAFFEFFESSAMSLNASKMRSVLERASIAISPHSSSSINFMSGSTLYPPNIVPK